SGSDGVIEWWGGTLADSQLVAAAVGVLGSVAVLLWLWMTSLGLRLRAMADNPTELALRGHGTDRLRTVAFLAAGVLVGLASLLSAYDVGFDAQNGLSALMLAVVAYTIGGPRTFG